MKPAMSEHNKGAYLLTGATGAIGKEIADYLAAQGEPIILACRNTQKAETLKRELQTKHKKCKSINVVELDLSSERSVRQCVEDIKSLLILDIVHTETSEQQYYKSRLNGIINNAGIMNRRFITDDSGCEHTMRVNYLNTMLLNELLKSEIADNGTIVFTTSLTRFLHRRKDYPTTFPKNKFSQLGTYGKSKRMITEYARRLSEELRPLNIRVNCADPGIVNSEMIRMQRWYDCLADIIFRPFIRSPHNGAKPTIRAIKSSTTGLIYCRWLTHKI